MSELLAAWLNNTVGLSRRVSGADFDAAFASGALVGEVLARLGVGGAPAGLAPAPAGAPGAPGRASDGAAFSFEAAIANYGALEAVLREALGVRLTPGDAFDLVTAKKGAAAQLLARIRAACPGPGAGAVKLPPIPAKATRRNTHESYPSSPTGEREITKILDQSTSPRKKYNQLEHEFFTETLRQKLRRVHRAGYKELDHPKLEHPEMDYTKLIQQRANEAKQKLEMQKEQKEQRALKAAAAEACEPSSVPSKKRLIPAKKELTQTEQAYAMREQAKLEKKRNQAQNKEKKVVQSLIQNLDAFEKNIHIDEKQFEDVFEQESEEAAGSTIDPVEIKNFVTKRAGLDPLQHSKELSRQMPSHQNEMKKTEEYVEKIRERKIEEEVSRKEREQRRRKIVLGHQQAKEEMEKSHLEELLLTKLMRQSKQERRIAEGLMQIRLEKDFMCENRMHREEQYAKRRQQDYEEALEREFILAEKAREEYKKQTQLQLAQHFEILAIKAGEKHIKNANICKEIVHQIVDLSFKISEYRELNDYDDAPPNPNMLRQWKILFIKGQPLTQILQPQLGARQEARMEQSIAKEDNVIEGIQLIDEEEFKHYIDGSGLWSTTSNAIKNGPLKNEHLGQVPKLPTVPLRLILLGKRFAGKKSVAKQLAAYFGLAFLSLDVLTKDAISEAEALEASVSDPKQKKTIAAGHIGTKLQQSMAGGNGPDDELLVNLVMESIKKHSAEDAPGWVLVDFPRNRYQAQLLEREISGYEDPKPVKPGTLKRTPTTKDKVAAPAIPPPVAAAAAAPKKKSLIAPADDKSDTKVPAAISGVDAVFLLDIDNETAVKRATGRRLDPVTGIEYHLELNPPPMNQPGVHERLVPVDDAGYSDTQLQYQIALFEEQEDLLKEWFARFNNLHIIDSVVSLEESHQSVKDIVNELADKKELEKQQKVKELPASEPAQAAPISKPPVVPASIPVVVEDVPAVPVVTPPDSKDDKKGGKGSAKARGGSGKTAAAAAATATAPPPERPPSRGASALQKPLDDKKRPNMIGIPDRSGGSAAVIYVEAPDASLPLLVRNVTSDGRKLPTKELAEILSDQWVTIEQTYTDTIKFAFRCLRREREAIMKYRHKTKVDFRKYLERPDKKQELLELFQKEYNSIEDDLRPDPDAKAELHQRAEDLREKLWEMSDKRRDEADAERVTIIEDRYIEDHFAIVSNIYISMMQAEVDKYLGAKQLALDYYKDSYGATVLGEYPKGHMKIPIVSPNSIPPVDTSVVVEALHKRRETMTTTIARPKAVSAAITIAKKGPGSASRIKFAGIGEKDSVPEPDPSMFCDLDVAMTVALGAIAATKPVHHEEPPPPEKDKKDKKKPAAAAVEAAPEAKVEAEAEMPPEYQLLVDMEDKILMTRLEKIKLLATMNLTEIRNIGIELYSYLDEIIGARFQAEMESIRDILYLIKEAVEAEVRLPNELILNGEKFRVNFNCLTYEPEPEPRPESPTEKMISDQFTVLQLVNLGRHFKGLAPDGFLTTKEFIENFQRLAIVSPGMDILPEVYMTADLSLLQQVANALDPYDTGFVNWRRFILTQARILPVPTLEQLITLKDCYLCADSYSNGTINKQDFLEIPLWFEEDQDDMQTANEDSAIPKFNRPAKLKLALFELFSVPQRHGSSNSTEQINDPANQSAKLLPEDEVADDAVVTSQGSSQEALDANAIALPEIIASTGTDGEDTSAEQAPITSNSTDDDMNQTAAANIQEEGVFDIRTFLMGCVLDEMAKAGLQKAFFIASERGDGGVNLQQLYEIFHFSLVLVNETNRLGTEQSEDPIPLDSLARVFEDAGIAPNDYIQFDQFCANLDGHTLLSSPQFILDDNLMTAHRARSPLVQEKR
ncbi:hypothetical protein BDR26DRAFT_1017305 [Obelidium mucronatum]|nr:hypothetical protein BDR26DRAFT_1017305 [Obelidium mucronatum]